MGLRAPGWSNEHLEVHLTSPVQDALVVEALAWTPGTNGTVNAHGLQSRAAEGPRGDRAAGVDWPPRAPARPRRSSTRISPASRTSVTGAAVLVGKAAFVPVNLDPPAGRLTDEQARCRFDPTFADNAACQGRGRGRFGGRGRRSRPAA